MIEIERIYQRIRSDFELRSGLTVYRYSIWSVMLWAVAVAAATLDKMFDRAKRQMWYDSKDIHIVRRWADFLLISYDHDTTRAELENRIVRRNELAGNIDDILEDYYANTLNHPTVGVRAFNLDVANNEAVSCGVVVFLPSMADITNDEFNALNAFALDNIPFAKAVKLYRPSYSPLTTLPALTVEQKAVLNNYFVVNAPSDVTSDGINAILIDAGLSSAGSVAGIDFSLPYTMGNAELVHFV